MKTLVKLTPTIQWCDGFVKLIDQTKLPLEESYITTDDYKTICESILKCLLEELSNWCSRSVCMCFSD